jgi:tetratricopeptide (TPR) repeat protein
MFYAQCWGLVHYMQMEKKKNSGKLNTYLQKVRSGVSSTDAARQVFGDFETLGLEINRYANLSLKRMRIPIELETRVDEYPVRDLTESESLAYRGGFLMVNRQMDQSETMLKKALQLDPTNPAAHEGMGMLLLRRGDQEKAGQHFATAAELGGASYLSYFYAANAAIKRDSNIDKAEEYLQKAVAINPEDAASRDFLKNILEHKESRLKAERAKEEWENRVRNSKPDSLSADLSEADGPSMDGTTTDKLAESNLVLDELSDDQLMERQELKRKIDESERPVRTGPKAKIEGTIGSVRCEYPAVMDITLESGGKQQTLRARNYYEVKYWVPEHAGEEEFDPCRDLKDCQVEIDYITAFDEDFIGLIQTIKIKE